MKYADRLESSLSRVFEIPDPSLNEQLVPTNDSKLTILSGENLEAGSILSQRDCIEPRSWIGPVAFAIAFGFAALAVFVALLLK